MKARIEHPFQNHPLANGRTVRISRDGIHQYWVGDNGPKMKSVTGMLRHIDGGKFEISMNWTRKKINESIFPGLVGKSFRSNPTQTAREQQINCAIKCRGAGSIEVTAKTLLLHTNAAHDASAQAKEEGNKLHEAIDEYIGKGIVAEENPPFLAWFHAVGQNETWLAAERFLFHPTLSYGGTLDAVSVNGDGRPALHDWKSVDAASWAKYGVTLRMNKDAAQLGAYADALHSMGSIWAPSKAFITYVMRDGSGAEVIEVDLERGLKLFKASRELFLLTQGG
jgi:hypothetical protein